jgi:cellobiose-specific phosphotransferase system component IIB
VETYLDLAFWDYDEIPAVKRLVNAFVKQSLGKKIPSKTMVDKLRETLKKNEEQIDVESAAKKILEEYLAKFNLFWQVQMMSVELALLAPSVWKKYKNRSDRTNDYEEMKIDLNNIEKDLPQFAVDNGTPVMDLGKISKTFFGDKMELIAECFGEASLKFIEKEKDEVEVKFAIPWLENLTPSSTSIRSWVRAYTWKKMFEDKKEKYVAYQKILSLYGLEAEDEFKKFLDYIKDVIREGK